MGERETYLFKKSLAAGRWSLVRNKHLIPRDQRPETRDQSGNVLFSALMVLIVLNLMAVLIVEYSTREQQISQRATVTSSTFYTTESCIRESMSWLKTFTRPPEAVPHNITRANLDHWNTGDETEAMLSKFAGYSYNCDVGELISKSLPTIAGGVGEGVGSTTGYGQTGDLSPAFFYSVDASGAGPSSSAKTINSIVSVRY